jgi:Ca2+-binding RTX toxin-like protein
MGVPMSFASSGVLINGVLTSHTDVNQYTVQLRAGETYDFWFAGIDTPAPLNDGIIQPTLADPLLTISGPGGPLSDDDTAEGRNALIRFTAPSTGTYTIEVQERAAAAGNGGIYTLHVASTSMEADIPGHIFLPNAHVGTDMHLAQGDVLISEIRGSDDADVVSVTLSGGTTYSFAMRGSDSNDGSLFDPELFLLNSNGVVVASNNDFGATHNSFFTFTPGASGTYFLAAKAAFEDDGTYELQFTAAGAAPDVPNGAILPYNVTLGSTIEGTLGIASDSDWYAIDLAAGQTYTLKLESSQFDPELFLRAAGGTILATGTEQTPNLAQITFTAQTSGRYYLDAHATGGAGTYQLSMSRLGASPTPAYTVVSQQADGDFLIGSDLPSSITGGAGNDSIAGGAGADTLAGGDGDDSVVGGFDFGVRNIMSGGDGNDTLLSLYADDVMDGGAGNDEIDGGSGADTATGGDGDDNLIGGDENDSLSGGLGQDMLNGDYGEDRLDGGAGDDFVYGGSDADTVLGGDGNDTIDGEADADLLNGGAGNDVFDNVEAIDTVAGGAGIDTVNTSFAHVLAADAENLNLQGTANVSGTGNALANTIFGNAGSNLIIGLGGNDALNGGAGADTLIGGAGKELLTGSGGLDVMRFTALSDSGTVFATRDAINTFAHGDKIDLSLIDANSAVAGNQAFVFRTNFTSHAGEVQFDQTATNAYLVTADVNGDAVADFSLNLYTAPGFGALQGFDFIL